MRFKHHYTTLLFLGFCLLSTFGFGQQNESFQRRFEGHSSFQMATLHAGSYSKERPIFGLEQTFAYRFHPRFTVGVGVGINLYPALLGVPIKVEGTYSFGNPDKKVGGFAYQSVGRNVKLFRESFNSQRYDGGLGLTIELTDQVDLVPQVGYLMLLDKYRGGFLSANFGVRLTYGL